MNMSVLQPYIAFNEFFICKSQNKNGTTFMVYNISTCRASFTVCTNGNLTTDSLHHHLNKDTSLIEKKIQQFSV